MLVCLDILFQNWLILHKIIQFRNLLLKYRLTDLHIAVKLDIFYFKTSEIEDSFLRLLLFKILGL